VLGLYLSSSVSVGLVGTASAAGVAALLGLAGLAGFAGLAGGCRGGADPAPTPPLPAIEVRDAVGSVTARVVPGHPCRATVEGVEILVGGRPLVAQQGAVRWTGEDAPNGTTFKKDGAPVARVHARQLFDEAGIPILRVLPDGGIVNRASVRVRSAAAAPTGNAVAIGAVTVAGTADVTLAAMLAAPEVPPDLRALVACHYLLGAP
jgi:hypothetical protein